MCTLYGQFTLLLITNYNTQSFTGTSRSAIVKRSSYNNIDAGVGVIQQCPVPVPEYRLYFVVFQIHILKIEGMKPETFAWIILQCRKWHFDIPDKVKQPVQRF